MTSPLFPPLCSIINQFDLDSIPASRKKSLQVLIDYILGKTANNELVNLNFICTHNSRRSHLSQVWAQAMAGHYDLKNVFCYSGGTEATALFPMVANTLTNQGFKIVKLSDEVNPVYAIKFAADAPALIAFSKPFDHLFNPASNFAAILTCNQADADCPFIAGADVRIPLPFEDPKVFDNTDQQVEKYAERSLQIAVEMAYVFSKIKA